MDQNRPILLFDSGVGGLTVLAALREIMPNAPVIYAADQAGLPYGNKSEAQIAARVAGLLGRMAERYDPCLACIACNTASTIALGMVREVLEIPIVGTVPAIKPAAAKNVTSLHIKRTIGAPGEAAIMFDMDTPGGTIPVCDWVFTRDGEITEIRSFYDATTLREP